VGEELSIQYREAMGHKLVGRQVTIDTPGGRTRLDLLFEDNAGGLYGVEAKHGPHAALTANQRGAFPHIMTTGGIARGANVARVPGWQAGKNIQPMWIEIDWWL
jgi:hypothetical protein